MYLERLELDASRDSRWAFRDFLRAPEKSGDAPDRKIQPWDACQIRQNIDWDPMKQTEGAYSLVFVSTCVFASQSFVKERPIPWMMTKTWPSKRSRIYGFSRKETQTTCSPNCRLKCVAELVEMGENTMKTLPTSNVV